ncbi:MAG TPA: TOMM system kinase/cyclase fusion protein, partial [Candidatus Binatia bacterium]|nr:TOMM system kinase/cyclase fusion protein [Candidatus Binatia bacterium]
MDAHEPALAIGAVFQGGYEILSRLGAGRFGWVFRARQLSTGQDVAIKILRTLPTDSVADIENQTARFRREMRLCAGLSHPSIVRLIDSGETADGMLYAVFEYVPGTTLREVLEAEGKLDVWEAIDLMSEVLDALACAHARGVVHRDLKPDNIMITKTGARRHALVLDFGLGGFAQEAEVWALPRLTATYEFMGTPCYAAPEQLRGEPPSTRSDLYSWGLVFLECLTGAIAVDGASGADVIWRQLGPEPIPIPEWLHKHRVGPVLEVVTAKQIEKRDVTIPGLLDALRAAQGGESTSSVATHRPDTLPEGERRQLTVVSCGLPVSPLAGRALDLEEVDEIVHAQHAVIAELAARSGGQVAGVLADRVLVVFGYPRAQEDDARRAARTTLAIGAELRRVTSRLATERGLGLEFRIGVHTGLAVVRQLRQPANQAMCDLVGLTPQVATRVEQGAAAGEVVVTADTHRLLHGEFTAEPAGELRPWSGGEPIALFRLTGEHRRVGPDTISWVRETPLVGRAAELNQLLDRWRQTRTGKAGAVLITGEPGIGKSRLVRELRRRVPPRSWLECRCVPESEHSPLRPIADLIASLPGPMDALLARYGFDVAETLPLFDAMLSAKPDGSPAFLKLTPERQKELTLEAIVALFVRIAEEEPIVLVLEDLHWADPTTLDLVGLLVREIQGAGLQEIGAPRLCAVLTARPTFTPGWSTEGVGVVSLGRLGRDDVSEMVSAGVGGTGIVSPALIDRIVRHADGIPLFVEEVTRILLESADATPETDDAGIEIPSTLRDLLAARLDGLSASGRETVQLGAALGREFRYEVLRAVARKEESLLREDLRELTDAGLLYPRASARAERYVFKHALVRDAAYETMTRITRQTIHGRIAAVLRQRFPEVERDQPETIALHFERGGNVESAVAYWTRAGYQAMSRAAYVESIHHLERALKLMESIPDRARIRKEELDLVQTLGMGLLATQGYASPAVEQIFDRALKLCGELGSDVPPLRVLSGVWGVQLTRGSREATAELLPKFRKLAQGSTDPAVLLAAHVTAGIRAFYTGDFAQAHDELERGAAYYSTAGVQRFIAEFGYDGGIYTYGYLVWTLWVLGHPDQAVAVRDRMMTLADESGHPYTLAVALAFSTNLAHDLRDPDTALHSTERAMEL